jgi:two-component system cell cycle sensor histidine kinase/response regulator CckA
MIRNLIIQLGLVKSTLIFSLFAILYSFLIYIAIGLVAGIIRPIGIFVSIVAPALIAPIICVLLIRTTLALYRAEKELLEAQRDLERRVLERTRELEESNRKLTGEIEERKRTEEERKRVEALLFRAQKMEAIGVLAGGVAHDLNNILTGLVTYPELLLLQLPPDSPLRSHVNTILHSGQRAAAVVQDLLTMARRRVAVAEVVDLNEIISEYLMSHEYEVLLGQHPGVRIETDLAENLLHILGSPVHLSKTVMNLLSNAVESIVPGGTIRIITDTRTLEEPLKGYDDVTPGDYVRLMVSDTGSGISQEHLPRIFEPFYTRKVMGRSGTGLGLAVVWGTVKDHDGYVTVDSEVGKGTTFTLYFPVTRLEPEGKMSTPTSEDLMGRGETILIVDDMEEQREIAAKILTTLGYTPIAVPSGEEAVNYVRTHSIDLLVIDMIMDPGIDGLETYNQVLRIHPGQKAIIVSGFSETDRVREAQRRGAGAYVKKPYQIDTLARAVKAAIASPSQPSLFNG